MTRIGLQEPTIKWLRWFAMMLLIGFALGSCRIEPDVVFKETDGSDTDSNVDNNADSEVGSDAGGVTNSEAGSDSETITVDSGSNILESGLNNPDGTASALEGGTDFINPEWIIAWIQEQLQFECPDVGGVPSEDACLFDSSSDENNYIFEWIVQNYQPVNSEDACIPSDSEYLEYLESRWGISPEDLVTTPESPWYSSPCPQICEALSDLPIINIGKLYAIFLLSNSYYVDPSNNIRKACPLTCEKIRCLEALMPEGFSLRGPR